MHKDSKKKALSQLKKAQGMLKKVIRMTEDDAYCIDLLQQSLAVIGMIKSSNKVIMENHLNCCFKEGMKSKSTKKQQRMVDEVLHIVNKTSS